MGSVAKDPINQKTSIADRGTRAVNFEALRILSMLMIVTYHCMVHGNVMNNVPAYSVNWLLYSLFYPLLQVGVNCYVLISGYFLCDSRFKASKMLNLWSTTVFWSVGLRFFAIAISHAEVSIVEIVKAFIPITQREYWFVTTYLLMYLCTPFLNSAIRHMTQRQHASALLMSFAVFIVLQNAFFWNNFTFASDHSPIFFFILYITSAYIRKYPPAKRNWGVRYLLAALMVFVLDTAVTLLSKRLLGYVFGGTAFTTFNSVPVYLESIFLFLAFRELRIQNKWLSKMILTISPLIFGVYLIHDHNDIRSLLWVKLFHCHEWGNDPFLLARVFGTTAVVFLMALLLEWLRKLIWKFAHVDDFLKYICERAERVWENLVSWILNKA